MPYVVRHTMSPQYDIQRNWSAWIGAYADTAYDLVRFCIPESASICRDLARAVGVDYKRVDDGDITSISDLWEWSDIEDEDEFKNLVVEHCNLDLRFNEAWGKWQLCHHEGLSCYNLETEDEDGEYSEETAADAIVEATKKAETFPWHGFGHQTVGAVRYIVQISDTLHLFWCEDVCREDDF